MDFLFSVEKYLVLVRILKMIQTSSVNSPNKRKLDKAPVTNLAEERSVDYINYELKNIRGRKQLESASKKMIIKKSLT